MKLENYKVRVSNEAESKEVQGLFEQLGFNCGEYWSEKIEPPFFIYNWNDGEFLNYRIDEFGLRGIKEITIYQLCNLVANQKTIGKVPYLVKTIDKWEEQELTSDTPESATCLKIPDGAEGLLYSIPNNKLHHFYKGNEIMSIIDIIDGNGYWYEGAPYINSNIVSVVWQRQPKTMPTNPEELPFIDDDPKMADIEQTLNERQSQYGSFKDVADTTQSLYLMLLNDDMTDVEREALHMICSKLSRIKHGDCHKIDSWHDIGGYATLVVKDLEQNNG